LHLDRSKQRKKERKDINWEGQRNVKRIKTLPVKSILKDGVGAETHGTDRCAGRESFFVP